MTQAGMPITPEDLQKNGYGSYLEGAEMAATIAPLLLSPVLPLMSFELITEVPGCC